MSISTMLAPRPSPEARRRRGPSEHASPSKRVAPVLGSIIILGLVAAGAVSCAGARLMDMWRDPAYHAGPMRNVMVVAMIRKDTGRRLWEDEFVEELGRHGMQATPSYRLFPDAPPDTLEIVDAVTDHHFDGVLAMNRLPRDTTVSYVPGYVTTEPVTSFNHWVMGYRTYWVDVYHRGHLETDEHVRNEIKLWSTGDDGHLVWAGTSEVIDPNSRRQVRDRVAERVADALAAQGLTPGS